MHSFTLNEFFIGFLNCAMSKLVFFLRRICAEVSDIRRAICRKQLVHVETLCRSEKAHMRFAFELENTGCSCGEIHWLAEREIGGGSNMYSLKSSRSFVQKICYLQCFDLWGTVSRSLTSTGSPWCMFFLLFWNTERFLYVFVYSYFFETPTHFLLTNSETVSSQHSQVQQFASRDRCLRENYISRWTGNSK